MAGKLINMKRFAFENGLQAKLFRLPMIILINKGFD